MNSVLSLILETKSPPKETVKTPNSVVSWKENMKESIKSDSSNEKLSYSDMSSSEEELIFGTTYSPSTKNGKYKYSTM